MAPLGPGSYELAREPELAGKEYHVPPKGANGESLGSASVFTSRVVREPFPAKAGPGPGEYDISSPAHFKNVGHEFGHRTGGEHVTDFAKYIGKSDAPGPTTYNIRDQAMGSAVPGITRVVRPDGSQERLGTGWSNGSGLGPERDVHIERDDTKGKFLSGSRCSWALYIASLCWRMATNCRAGTWAWHLHDI